MIMAKNANLTAAQLEQVASVIEDLKTLHTGAQALIELLGDYDWSVMRDGSAKLRGLLERMEAKLGALEQVKAA